MENRIFIDDDFIQKCYTDFIASQIENKLKLCDFSQPITFNNFEQTIIAPMIDNNEEIQYFTGATKGVIKFLNKQYVLKIPFYNEKEPIWDKCNKEMQLYQQAKDNGLKDFFAPVVLITAINEHPIYFQPYCKTVFSCMHTKDIPYFSEKQQKKAWARFHTHYIPMLINNQWLTDIYVLYGEKTFDKLIKFLKENSIIDLHEENIGFTMSGNPVIIDYYV